MSDFLMRILFLITTIFLFICSNFINKLHEILMVYLLIYLNLNIFLIILFKGFSFFNGFQIIIFFNFLYTFLYPFLAIIGKVNTQIFIVKNEILKGYITFNIQSISLFSILAIIFSKKIDILKLKQSLKNEYLRFKESYIMLIFFSCFLIFNLYKMYFYSKLGREGYLNIINKNIAFHYFNWATIAYISIYLYLNYTKEKIKYVIILMTYIILVLKIGNRREVSYVAIVFLSYYFLKKQRIKIKLLEILGILLVFLGMIGWSLYRNQDRIISSEHNYINTYGEFLIPAQVSFTLLSEDSKVKYLGKTYFLWPAYTIPRKFYKEKPVSLSEEYYKKYSERKGLGGFTPFSESYINFNQFAGVFLGLYLFFIAKFLTNYLIYKNFLLFTLFYMQVMNFMRGETGTTLIEILMFYIFLNFLFYIKKIKFNGERL